MTDPSLDWRLRHLQMQRQVSACMGFAGRPEGETFTWETQLQAPFRAQGLLVWGVTNDTLIHDIRVGHASQLKLSDSGFPARFFEAGITFTDFGRLLDPDADKPSYPDGVKKIVSEAFFAWMKETPPIDDHQRIEVDTCSPGVYLSITCSGPIEALAFWGKALR